jgi:hypothetical protein
MPTLLHIPARDASVCARLAMSIDAELICVALWSALGLAISIEFCARSEAFVAALQFLG